MRTRRIALLVANGVEGKSLEGLHAALTAAGAIPVYVGPRLGTYATAEGGSIEAEASLENSPAVLFDALILPGGEDGVRALANDGHTVEYIVNQYRHCKTILALGGSTKLLERAGVSTKLGSGALDAGVLTSSSAGSEDPATRFIAALAMHRHRERETDPPLI